LRPEQTWQGDRLHRILVTFGGADPGNLTLNFLQRLRPLLAEADLEVTAIAGPVFHPNHRYHLQNLAQEEPRIHVVDAPSSLAELILEHDLTVTLGGITSYEAMCLGRACGAIAWEQKATHVEALAALDLLENLGTVEQAVDTLRDRLMEPTRLRTLANNGWQTIDGQGSDRIVAQIMQRVQSRQVSL
jgi:spore coat polysaccharide biosynthesis predicted glycosyltransferase SpsG